MVADSQSGMKLQQDINITKQQAVEFIAVQGASGAAPCLT
jgi:hypothetical protein